MARKCDCKWMTVFLWHWRICTVVFPPGWSRYYTFKLNTNIQENTQCLIQFLKILTPSCKNRSNCKQVLFWKIEPDAACILKLTSQLALKKIRNTFWKIIAKVEKFIILFTSSLQCLSHPLFSLLHLSLQLFSSALQDWSCLIRLLCSRFLSLFAWISSPHIHLWFSCWSAQWETSDCAHSPHVRNLLCHGSIFHLWSVQPTVIIYLLFN